MLPVFKHFALIESRLQLEVMRMAINLAIERSSARSRALDRRAVVANQTKTGRGCRHDLC